MNWHVHCLGQCKNLSRGRYTCRQSEIRIIHNHKSVKEAWVNTDTGNIETQDLEMYSAIGKTLQRQIHQGVK